MSVKSQGESPVSEIKAQAAKVDLESSEKDIDSCHFGNKGSKSKSRKKMWRKVDLRSLFPDKPLSLEVIFGAEIAVECEKKQPVRLSYAAVAQKNTGTVWKPSRYQTKDREIASRSEEHCSLPKNSFLIDDLCLFPKISYQPEDSRFLLPKNSYQTEDHWLFPGKIYKREDHCSLPTSNTLPEDHYLMPKKSYKVEDCCTLSKNSCLTVNHSLLSKSICQSENTCLLSKKHAKSGDNRLVPKKHSKTGENFLVPKKPAKTEDNCLISKEHTKTRDSSFASKNNAKTEENFLLPKNDENDDEDDICSLSEESLDCVKDSLLSKKTEGRYFLTKNKYLTEDPSLHYKNCYPTEHHQVRPKDSHQNDSHCFLFADSCQIKDCCFLPEDISQIKNAYCTPKNNYGATIDHWLLSDNNSQYEDLSVVSTSDVSSEGLDLLTYYIYWSEDYCLMLKYSYEIEDDLLIPHNMSKVEDETIGENTFRRDLLQESISDIFDLHHSHCCKEHNEKVNIPYTLTDIVEIIKSDTKLNTTETDDLAENIAINGLDLGITASLVSKLWGSGRKRMAYAKNLCRDQETANYGETVKECYPLRKEGHCRKWGITCNKNGCLHEDL
ncbi:uncharacterized protein Cdc23 isoform X2 [Anabrus simplex]